MTASRDGGAPVSFVITRNDTEEVLTGESRSSSRLLTVSARGPVLSSSRCDFERLLVLTRQPERIGWGEYLHEPVAPKTPTAIAIASRRFAGFRSPTASADRS